MIKSMNTDQVIDYQLAHTQGEILLPSLQALLPEMALTFNDVFADLGSGNGQVVLQIFLETEVKKAIGVEILSYLHQEALHSLKEIKNSYPSLFTQREVIFLEESFLKTVLNDATVVFMNAVCFDQPLLHGIVHKLNQFSHLRMVLSTRPLHELSLSFNKTIKIECSWDSALCYIYTKQTS